MREVQMQSYKHDGRKHRGWARLYEIPGESHLFWIEPDTPVIEADGKEWSSPFPVIFWMHPETWYNVFLLCREDGTAYYCNVASPPEWKEQENAYAFIDYDVDLIVNSEGVAEVVDEEELTEHAHAMRYPQELLHKIAEATAELTAMFEAQEGPFDPEARDRWTELWRETCSESNG